MMAEYIEREALLNALKEERKNGNFVFTSKWIKEIMDNLPTADVVPKSEVQELIKETDSMIELVSAMTGLEIIAFGRYTELKKKYTEEKSNVVDKEE